MTGLRLGIERDIARQAALSARITRAQGDIASGKRIDRASDDPAAAARVAQLATAQTDGSAWAANADRAAALSASGDATLASAESLIDRARELATGSVSASASPQDRAAAAAELAALADDLDALAATKDAGGASLFPDQPLAIPVGAGERIAVSLSRADAFGDASTVLRQASAKIAQGDPSALDQLAATGDRLTAARSVLGTRAARIERVRERLTDTSARQAEERGALEETDIAATVARSQADQLSLDAARGLFARVNRQTLFDLLG